MSILTDILKVRTALDISTWSLDTDEGSEPRTPYVFMEARITVPVSEIDEDLWYMLDDNFRDPETNTEFYSFDYDEDDDHRWGKFSIHAYGTDIPAILEILQGEINDMLSLLTSLQSRTTTDE